MDIKKIQKHIVIDARIRGSSTGRPVDRLLYHLQKTDHTNRYTIILASKDSWQPDSDTFSVAYTRYPNFSFNLFNQVLYAKQLRDLQPDLVYFTLSPQGPMFYFGPQITLTHDLSMLHHVRAGRLPGWLHALRMKGYRILLWTAHKKAIRIVVPTQFVADEVTQHHSFTGHKISTIHEAAETPQKSPGKTPKSPPHQFILYVGSAFPHKNLERLIEAFHILKKNQPDLKLVLVGKREYHSLQLEQWTKTKSNSSGVLFPGFVPDEELKWYYEHARAYVFPSLSEGFGLPGLEAMAHGCPVVSSNATCLPEVHGDAAHYFDPEDVQDMAQKIEEVITNEDLRKKLIKKGYLNVKRFSWESFAEQHLTLFDQTLRNSR